MIPFVVSIKHSGTHTMRAIVAGLKYREKLRKLPQFGKAKEGDNCQVHFEPLYKNEILKWREAFGNMIVPLRDPRAMCLSWYMRRRQESQVGNFIEEWRCMVDVLSQVDHFIFPMEIAPYDELEKYLGQPVHRIDQVLGTMGDYPEKQLLRDGKHDELRKMIGQPYKHAMKLVQSDPIASKYYEV